MEIKLRMSQLKTKMQNDTWHSLCSATLAHTLLLNKRKDGEGAKVLVDSYVNCPNWKDSAHKEIIDALSPMEKNMFEYQSHLDRSGRHHSRT